MAAQTYDLVVLFGDVGVGIAAVYKCVGGGKADVIHIYPVSLAVAGKRIVGVVGRAAYSEGDLGPLFGMRMRFEMA